MPTETELKFSLTSDAVPEDDVLAAAFAAGGMEIVAADGQVIKDRYYDDARLSLGRAGVALRRRMVDGRLLATLKTLGTVEGALHRREEIELPIDGAATALDPWPGPIADRIRTVTDPRSLRGTFELVTDRRRFEVREDGRTLAVAAFDDVAASRSSADRSVHWNELEIESAVPEDDPAAANAVLERAAEAFRTVLDLVPASHTKLERARALLMLGAALDEPGDEPRGGRPS